MIVQSSRPRPVLPRNSRARHVLVRAQIDRLEVERTARWFAAASTVMAVGVAALLFIGVV